MKIWLKQDNVVVNKDSSLLEKGDIFRIYPYGDWLISVSDEPYKFLPKYKKAEELSEVELAQLNSLSKSVLSVNKVQRAMKVA